MPNTYSGSCQCGKVAYDVDLDLGEVIACNCSRCGRLGLLLAFAPVSQFRLKSGEENLSLYQFNRHAIDHYFCSTCGIQSFAKGRKPDGSTMAAVNVRCLEGVDVDALQVRKVDGRSF